VSRWLRVVSFLVVFGIGGGAGMGVADAGLWLRLDHQRAAVARQADVNMGHAPGVLA
jgi:hypothetical protein